jgi:SAM-dependent methyltransferase
MIKVQSDTFERSCEHWSDAGRDEMEAFYELARVDYRYLAEAYDWADAFQSLVGRKGGVRLIDVACGSGKFPQALLAYAGVANLAKIADFKLDYDLLDPSPFSIREARQALASPFRAGAEFCCTLQDWKEEPGQYDIAWATHALYCVPAEELEQALARMCSALSPDGFGFLAQGLRDGHYVGFYDHYRASLFDGQGTPYSDGAQVEAALINLGMRVRTRVLEYTTVVPAHRPELLESYLQRCAFDDTIGLDEMLRREPLAGYLSSCHDLDSGEYRFPQRVGTTLFSHTEAGLALRDAKVSGID